MAPRSSRAVLAALLLLSSTMFAAIHAADVTTEDLLRRHVAARGGAERWKGVTSLELTGTQTTFSTPHPFTLLRRRPNLYRLEQTVLRQPVVDVYDGDKAWSINGLLGYTWPLAAPPPFSDVIRREAEFDTPLLSPQPAAGRIEVAGLEDFEGRQAWKVKVTRPGGDETWYVDPRTWLEVARISKTVDFFEEMEKRSYFSDFRTVGGLVIPHHIDMEYGTRSESLQIEKVAVNGEVDPARFRMPPPEGMAPLQSMAGEWDLKIETRPGPRAPWVAETATSSIAARLGGGMLEEKLSHVDQGFPLDIVRTYSYDRYQKVYRITSTDTFAFQQNVMEGTLTDGRLVAGNEKTGTAQTAPPDRVVNAHVVLYEIQPDGFKMDLESSTDGGKTWNTDAKYTYTRRH